MSTYKCNVNSYSCIFICMTYTASAPEGTPDQAQVLVCVATLALAGVVAGGHSLGGRNDESDGLHGARRGGGKAGFACLEHSKQVYTDDSYGTAHYVICAQSIFTYNLQR